MIIALVLITVLYVLPLWGSYTWVHKAHSQGGIYEILKPEGKEFWFTILPVMNIFFVFILWEEMPLKGQTRKWNFVSKFFQIKK